MGIPFYYRNLIQKNPKLLKSNISLPELDFKNDYLFFDYNALMHPVAQTSAQTSSTKKYVELAHAIIDETYRIINLYNPLNIIICVDGVAPMAKMVQQRRRRYMSGFRNKLIEKKPAYDSNAITPGTKLMHELHKVFEEEFVKNPKITYSSFKEPGEGEHKIINYIKTNLKSDDSCIIYGLDADLIMLTLGLSQQVYLIRDDKLLDIAVLRESIILEYNIPLNDYITLCFLLGNDFIPCLPFLKIREGAIDILLDTYKSIIGNDVLVNKKNIINLEVLLRIIESLSKSENKYMLNAIHKYNEYNYIPRSNCTSEEKKLHKIDAYPVINKNILSDNWRKDYYKYIFNIHKACIDYIDGILWTANYYFKHKFDKSWCYQNFYAPTILDLHNYLLKHVEFIGERQRQLTKGPDYIDYDLQLLLVLPPESIDLIDTNYHEILTNITKSCLHMYPRSFMIHMYLKHYLWECIPLIPSIDIQKISNEYQKIKNKIIQKL